MEMIIHYFMIMLFVISTIFTLVFMTNIDDEVVPLEYRRRLMFPLYFGFIYIIASLSDSSMGMVMMAYVPAVIAIVFADWQTALVVAIAKPLINSLYLHNTYPASEISNLWMSLVISWLTLLVLALAFYKFGKSKAFYIIVAIGLGVLEDFQAAFYPTTFSGLHVTLVVNVLSYLIILWFAMGLKKRLYAYEENIQQKLYRDPLTGVHNFRAFNEGKPNNPDSNPYVIGVVDVDHFKHLNDTLGHGAGNDIIQMMANTLTEMMGTHFPSQEKGVDKYRVFRFGGEEFVIVIMDDGDLTRGMLGLKDILEEANSVFSQKVEHAFHQTASFSGGISNSRLQARGYDSFRKADALLYTMKNSAPGEIAIDTDA